MIAIRKLLLTILIVGLLEVSMTSVVSAEPNSQGNCWGQEVSRTAYLQGDIGDQISGLAQNPQAYGFDSWGELLAYYMKNNCRL